ncbi:hypothetical protein J3R83DRAFT_1564 [Lanmaoa asiatica]|nr:hypothetical protein J3R83DRAFT_1564 [Lanmaoa asiatica]
MTFRLVLTKKDPRCTDFILVGDHALDTNANFIPNPPVYTSDTISYSHPRNGSRATTTITRTDPTGDRFQVGIIEWPAHRHDRVQLVVGTRNVQMARSGIYTSPERFTATDGYVYEWQIQDGRPQLVPLRTYDHPSSTAYVATFVQSQSGFFFCRKHTSSLFVPPEGLHILDDIVVTFVYFESKWREKENIKSRTSLSGPMI